MSTDLKIRAIRSQVWICAACHMWLGRMPVYAGEGDKGDCCERCGNTSMIIRDGRPFGPRSSQWEWLIEEVREFLELFEEGSYERKDLMRSLVVDDD